MFFVLSSGRSGSQSIAVALNEYKNCTCYHEREPDFAVEAPLFHYGQYSSDKIKKMFMETRPKNSSIYKYGESNLQFCLILPVLESMYPEAKYIWLIRDGRDVVASMYDRKWFDTEDKTIWDEWKKARLQGDLAGDFSVEEWKHISRFSKCCWLWKKYNLLIENHVFHIEKSRWRRVRLDRLKTDMPGIAQFLGLNEKESVPVEKRNVAYQPVTYWENWNSEQRHEFEVMCGEVMDRWFKEWKGRDGQWNKIEPEKPDSAGFILRVKRGIIGVPRWLRMKGGWLKRKMKGDL